MKGWQAIFFLVSFTAIPVLMLIGTLLTWIGKPFEFLNTFLTWFFLPFHILFVTLSWCIVALFSSTVVMISGKPKILFIFCLQHKTSHLLWYCYQCNFKDFCSGNESALGPNGSLLSILEETGYQEKELLFEGSTYWIDVRAHLTFAYQNHYNTHCTNDSHS